MAEIIQFSKCRDDFQEGDFPRAIRIPRPLRDLLRSSRDGLVPACRRAWSAAAAAPGEWVQPDARALLAGAATGGVQSLAVRARDDQLHLQMKFPNGSATAIRRRLIVVARLTDIPDTIKAATVGGPLSRLVAAPFLDDPALTIQRFIYGMGGNDLDIRCRCPSHVVVLTHAPTTA